MFGLHDIGLCEGARYPGIVVTGSCQLPCGCWELNPGPLEEQSVMLTAKPSSQPSNTLLKLSILQIRYYCSCFCKCSENYFLFVVFDPLIANVSVVMVYSLSFTLLSPSYFVSLILIFNVLAKNSIISHQPFWYVLVIITYMSLLFYSLHSISFWPLSPEYKSWW